MFVLDAHGRIRYKLYGYEQVYLHLEGAIRALLQEIDQTAPGGS